MQGLTCYRRYAVAEKGADILKADDGRYLNKVDSHVQ